MVLKLISPKTKRPKGKARKRINSLIQRMYASRPAMMIVSLVIAIGLWLVISISIYPTTPRTIYHVALSVDVSEAAEADGLQVISQDVEEVTVQIEGNRSQIGNLSAEDLTASAVTDEVTTSGTRSLSIAVTSNDGTTFDVKDISPAKVSVVFDYIVSKEIEVRPSTPNITYEEECVLDEENYVCDPNVMTISGPQKLVDQISYAVAESSQTEKLSSPKILMTSDVSFYSESNSLVDVSELEQFTFDMPAFSITIPVLYQEELGITYQITNVPYGFDVDSLNLELSEESIILAYSNATVNDMSEFNLASIPLRDINLDYSQDFTIEIPDGYTNQSGFTTVTVSLNSEGLAKKDFVLSDIGIINNSASYDFEVLTSQLTVSVIGPEDEIANLDASDLTANVDLLSYSVQADAVDGETVTFNYTPTISCSKYSDVWAVGDYNVSVQGARTDSTITTTEEASETTTTEAET